MSKNDSFVEISGFMLNFVRHFVSWNPANDGLMLPQDHFNFNDELKDLIHH